MPKILVSNRVNNVGIKLLEGKGFELTYAPDQKNKRFVNLSATVME